MKNKIHNAFGIYGIIYKQDKLLVIDKKDGPYKNRYDLPGGSMEENETLEDTLKREILEETGIKILKYLQLGTLIFQYPWHFKDFNLNRHFCVFYKINLFSGKLLRNIPQFKGQDSIGCHFISLNKIDSNNSSLLVIRAKQLINNQDINFTNKSQIIKNWIEK